MKTAPDAKAHVFPVQIGLQAQEFIQATIYHHAFMDTATSQRIRQDGGFDEVRSAIIDGGISQDDSEQAWDLLHKFQDIFTSFIRQNVLIMTRSHWDWYIDKLGRFVVAAHKADGETGLSSNKTDKLLKIGHASITSQLKILQDTSGVDFGLNASVVDSISEMSLVRNIGIHNRWEVSQLYLDKSKSTRNWEIGEIRTFEISELEEWHRCLINLIHQTALAIAKRYKGAPDVDIT